MKHTANLAGSPGKTKVAIVDDEPQVGRMLARLLASKTVEPVVFRDPAEALRAARSEEFAVIVSDIIMPGMDGIEMMRQLRQFDFDLPVILLTGTPTFDTARHAVELGAFRYLTKPPNAKELRAAVEKAAFAFRIAKFRREAAELQGLPRQGPGDLLGLNVALEAALETLWIAYQPIVRAGDGSVFGYEALMRTESETLSHPCAILSAAETLGRVHDVGRTVRRKVTGPMGDVAPEIVLFLNLHPRDLLDNSLSDPNTELARIAHRVVLEITERSSLDKVPDAEETIGWMRSQQYRVAIDDLGSGYAGLTSFATLEPEFVKLDMSLIRNVNACQTRQKLVRSVVELSRAMAIQVVAEGIETREERETCVALGVDLLQGYLIARPGPPFPAVSW